MTVKNAEQMKKSIDDTVKVVTGASSPEDAKEKIKTNPDIEAQIKIKLAELSLEAQRIENAGDDAFNERSNADTADARQTLLKLLNEPESRWVTITPSIISYIVVLCFFTLVFMLLFGRSLLPNDPTLLQIINVCIGAAAAGFATVLNFWLGSSLGSRRKDTTAALATTVENVKSMVTPPRSPAEGNKETPLTGGKTTGPDTSGREQGPSAAQRSLPDSLRGTGGSTDSSTVNVLKNVPPSGGVPASFRYNNPGAQYPSREAARFGQLGFGVIGGGHKIACFPSPVNGAASNFDLLSRKYVGMSIGEAGKKWTGANGFGVPGYDSNTMLTKIMLDDPAQAVPLLKAIAGRESGKGNSLSDEQWRYAFDMYKSGSADAFLAGFGRAPATAVLPVRPDGPPDDALEVLLVKALTRKNFVISSEVGEINIVYVEGMNEDGSPNNDEANEFNDLRCIFDIQGDGTPRMLGKWQATTEPGFYYDRDHPINVKGAARIKFNQYQAWQVGLHRGTQEALRQVKNVTVCRDLNRDMERTGDTEDDGLFGINQHGGYDQPESDIGKASAGCLVGRTMSGHEQFMRIVKTDPRYVADNDFIFFSTILSASDVLHPDIEI